MSQSPEFITVSLWDSIDAIRAFAGHDIEAAVLYPENARHLVGESTVAHYQIVDQVEPAPGSGETEQREGPAPGQPASIRVPLSRSGLADVGDAESLWAGS